MHMGDLGTLKSCNGALAGRRRGDDQGEFDGGTGRL